MKKNKITILAFLMIALTFVTPVAANQNEDLEKYRKMCVEAIGNDPLCTCKANALKTHVQETHVKHSDKGPVFSEIIHDDIKHTLTMAASACFDKFGINRNDDLEKYLKKCEQAIGNEALCVCKANALKMHVPETHVKYGDNGPVFSETIPDDVKHAVTEAAQICFSKFYNKKK